MGTASAPAERALGKYEELCWARHDRDLALAYPDGIPADPRDTKHPRGFWFDQAAGERVVYFIQRYCRHHKGQWAGQPFMLADWQAGALLILFGWKRPDGMRRFSMAYLEVPRKNGKSELAAAIGLYLTVADHEPGAEVYASATKKDQAKIVHGTAVEMVKRSPALRRWFGVFRNNLSVHRSASKFEPLGADSNTQDGLNPHGNIIDELHAHRDRALFDVLITAMGARQQPLTLMITTAGKYDPEAIGYQQHVHAQKVLEEHLEDDTLFAFIACADPEADWRKPETWATANPNIGISVRPEYLQEQAARAEAEPSFLPTFLRLHLNVWPQTRDAWLQMEKWNACDEDRPPAWHVARLQQLAGHACMVGMDLSSNLDITAVAYLFRHPGEVLEAVVRYYVPEERIQWRAKKDRVPYEMWVKQGLMVATPGNVVDYEFIRADLKRQAAGLHLLEVGYDPWNATDLVTRLQADGLSLVEVRQGPATLSAACKELEKLVMAGKFRHGGHPILRWMASNVVLRRDVNDNIAPDKKHSADRIDGIAAIVTGLARVVRRPDFRSIYETQGIRFL